MQSRKLVSPFLGAAMFASLLGACATGHDIDRRIAESEAKTSKKIETVETQVEDVQQKQNVLADKQRATDEQVAKLSQTAADALKRAQEAGVLAKGKVAFEQTFSEDRVRFKIGSADLSKESQSALDDFGGKVKALGEPYFIEIQGHTDDVGSSKYNDDLGQRRAEAVRRYLGRGQKLPLNRMSTISYGDSAPVSSNKTKKGRAENRRVVIVVLE
jgi:peptidoglycan-associated lipoprotein